MLSVKNLIDGKVTYLDDKLFWYANKILFQNNKIKIYASNNSLVAFDNYCSELNIECISSFVKPVEIKNNSISGALVSSGSFLFVNDKLLATKRTSATKFDPNCWTSPAGRCDRAPLVTAIKETMEEIEIKDSSSNVLLPDVTRDMAPNEDYRFYSTKTTSQNISLKLYEILFFIDDILMETSKMWAYFSASVNTLELRLPLFFESNEYFLFSNPEFFTETKILDLQNTDESKLVPALKQLKKELWNENR